MTSYRNANDFDDDYDDGDDDAWQDDEESPTLPCPYCGMDIYEDAEVCPECGSFIVMEETRTARPLWVIATAVLLLVLILLFWIV